MCIKDAINELEKTLGTLKDFQRETVTSIMQEFNNEGSQRVLVADEVGLGKTIVAKGIIAQLLIDQLSTANLWQSLKPFRVTYICSNLSLAKENRKKLAVFKNKDAEKNVKTNLSEDSTSKYVKESSFGRLLEIAVSKQEGKGKDEKETSQTSEYEILEVCSLTPSTSFNLTQGHGNRKERLIIYAALRKHDALFQYRKTLSDFFRAGVKNWFSTKNEFIKRNTLDENIVKTFHNFLENKLNDVEKEHCGINLNEIDWLGVLVAISKKEISFKENKYKTRIRTSIRSLLARACAKHLTADLFILDEFQRFKALLDTKENNDDSLVAREIFNNKHASKILLLSATPFKAYSRVDDDEDGNAHAEELNFLLKFISNSNQDMLDEYQVHRKTLQQQILALKNKSFDLNALTDKHKIVVEKNLKKYICRTEREQISKGYGGLFKKDVKPCSEYFSKKDIDAFKALDQLGQGLQKASHGHQAGQLMEFYKAAPWPLSFLSGYQFKVQLDNHKNDNAVKKPLSRSDAAWLSRDSIEKYGIKLDDAPHAKTRALVKKIFQTPSEELLWVPPTLCHYPLEGSFRNQQNFSKTLLFSSWAMVPRALSGLISYEAERRLLMGRRGLKKSYYKDVKHSPNIKFTAKASLAGWGLVYPSKVLMNKPLNNNSTSLAELLKNRTEDFQGILEKFADFQHGSRSGDRWYALAPMLLDYNAGYGDYVKQWVQIQRCNISSKNEHNGKKSQFEFLCKYLENDEDLSLGEMPSDLAQYLAYLSIAGPAVTIARTWHRNWFEKTEGNVAASATEAAFAVVGMFNKPESESILNKKYRKPKYFQAIIHYCADGGFQALIDEYGHLLKDSGLEMSSSTGRLVEIMGFRTSSVACQFCEDKNQRSVQAEDDNKHTLRCHYAVPLGNQKTADEKGLQRVSHVRDAFNSPFKPFMLNSTSIGQEGLDFHWYCHNIVHWNLPGNPIDIEQREGRVNRYKSLVVRKRVTEVYQQEVEFNGTDDPWVQLFKKADEITRRDGRYSDLVPYWHIPEGKAQIERFVPLLPMSKDVAKLDHLLKVLAMYRLAFGQPRQEDLLENLLNRDFSPVEFEKIKQALEINLSPLCHKKLLEIEASE